VIAVLTPEQMRQADAAALAAVDEHNQHVFIQRAGYSVAVTARRMMGGCYGKRVVVIAGKGHNGDDGRVAAQHITLWGASVNIVSADEAGELFIDPRNADLVIDAAYGIGFRGTWTPPIVFNVPVLAVDLPSGLNALDGTVEGGVLVADRTVTFVAPKTGMLLGDGPSLCGEIDIIDVGIDVVEDVDTFLVQSSDIAAWLPMRDTHAHKWDAAVRVVAGSTGMGGAASLVSAAAMRAGAGIVHLSWRQGTESFTPPTEVVGRALPFEKWSEFISADINRFESLVVGPGLGRGDDVTAEVQNILTSASLPTVIDGDGLHAAIGGARQHDVLAYRNAETVLTPHDGEFAALGGDAMQADRIAATRDLAARANCIVLRKGPTTVVSNPDGAVYLVVSGDERLATAGSGDVLAGIIGAFIARGLAPHEAAAAAAHVHGVAGASGAHEGLIARDLVALISEVLSEVVSDVR
jgi:NAD(P)H-hydrate epimerase